MMQTGRVVNPMVAKEHFQEPLSPAKRARLEKIFEHAKKSPNDFDYATELFAQCVMGEPGNINYVRAYIENLQKKYHNQKIGPLVQFKERATRSALKKALAQQQWNEVIQHGLKVLTVNPWDTPALTGMATAAMKLGHRGRKRGRKRDEKGDITDFLRLLPLPKYQ